MIVIVNKQDFCFFRNYNLNEIFKENDVLSLQFNMVVINYLQLFELSKLK